MRLWIILIAFVLSSYINRDENVNVITVQKQDTISIAAGDSAKFTITIFIKQGYKIQANRINDEYLIPTTFDITPIENFRFSVPSYPDGKPFKLEGMEKDLLVYEDSVTVSMFIISEIKTKPDDYNLKGEVYYQACDKKYCLFPTSLWLNINVKVLGEKESKD